MLRKLFAIGLCVIYVVTLCYVVSLAVFGPKRLRRMAEPILNPQALANAEANVQRLKDEPSNSGKFIIDYKGKDAPIYQLGKTTVGEMKDGSGLKFTSSDKENEMCQPSAAEPLYLHSSTGRDDFSLTVANQTDEPIPYLDCVVMCISNNDSLMVAGGAHIDMGWDQLSQIYGGEFVQETLVLDATENEKFGHVYDIRDNIMQGNISFSSAGGDEVDAISYDIYQKKVTPTDYLNMFQTT